MRMSELLPYLDLTRIKTDILQDILRSMSRWAGPIRTPDTLHDQYSDELHEVEIEQARMDLERTRAETAKALAQAKAALTDARQV